MFLCLFPLADLTGFLKGFSKATVTKALASLAEKDLILAKTYGKQIIYSIKQVCISDFCSSPPLSHWSLERILLQSREDGQHVFVTGRDGGVEESQGGRDGEERGAQTGCCEVEEWWVLHRPSSWSSGLKKDVFLNFLCRGEGARIQSEDGRSSQNDIRTSARGESGDVRLPNT